MTGKRWWRGAVPLVVLALAILIPAGLYGILTLGFPPVMGNLLSARAMKQYASQVYPEWKAQGSWAGFNLVDGRYWLSFSTEEGERTLGYDRGENLIRDEKREEALLAEADVDGVIRRNNLWQSDRLATYCHVSWTPQNPEAPVVSLRSDFYGQEIPEGESCRETMAELGMKLYDAFSPVLPIHTLSVHYGYSEPDEAELSWISMVLDLEEDEPPSQMDLLAAPVTRK